MGLSAAGGDAGGIPGGGTGRDMEARSMGGCGNLGRGSMGGGGGWMSWSQLQGEGGHGSAARATGLRGEGLLPRGMEAGKAPLGDMTLEMPPCLSVLLGGRVLSWI